MSDLLYSVLIVIYYDNPLRNALETTANLAYATAAVLLFVTFATCLNERFAAATICWFGTALSGMCAFDMDSYLNLNIGPELTLFYIAVVIAAACYASRSKTICMANKLWLIAACSLLALLMLTFAYQLVTDLSTTTAIYRFYSIVTAGLWYIDFVLIGAIAIALIIVAIVEYLTDNRYSTEPLTEPLEIVPTTVMNTPAIDK